MASYRRQGLISNFGPGSLPYGCPLWACRVFIRPLRITRASVFASETRENTMYGFCKTVSPIIAPNTVDKADRHMER